jgi:hypothetical protein
MFSPKSMTKLQALTVIHTYPNVLPTIQLLSVDTGPTYWNLGVFLGHLALTLLSIYSTVCIHEMVLPRITVDSATAASQNGFCSFPSEKNHYYSEHDKNIQFLLRRNEKKFYNLPKILVLREFYTKYFYCVKKTKLFILTFLFCIHFRERERQF